MQVEHSDSLASTHDWQRTDLGEPAHWPPELRNCVDIMLNTPLPMMLLWGPRRILVLNQAYAALADAPHVRAPGGRVPPVFPEAWSVEPAAVAAAWQGRPACLARRRVAFLQVDGQRDYELDLHFTPIRDAGGAVAGVLCGLAQPAAGAAAAVALPLRILVVEDDADARYLLCEMLRACGHQAEAVGDAEAALVRLDIAERFDVLFCDVSLPGMSGVDLARQARAVQPALRIVFATGYGQNLLRQVGFPYVPLQKPYDFAQLEQALAALTQWESVAP